MLRHFVTSRRSEIFKYSLHFVRRFLNLCDLKIAILKTEFLKSPNDNEVI